MTAVLLALLLGCPRTVSGPAAGDGGSVADGGSAYDGGGEPGTVTEQHCAEVEAFGPVFADTIAGYAALDALAAQPSEGLVFVGSSSIRRWEDLALAYTDHRPIQRGVGGAQLGELALFATELILRHAPRGVVVFGGTNDVAAGVSAEVVVERFRCLRERVGNGLSAETPIFFIGITPTPSRWDQWETASAVNAAIQSIAATDPAVVYVDVPSAFLATGQPPADELFVSDGLHLSEEGYALWDSVLRPVIDGRLSPWPAKAAGSAPLATGTRLLVDLGPGSKADGEATPSPDYLGQHWNNWHDLASGDLVLPGHHLSGLVDDAGRATGIELVVTGGFFLSGRSDGGLLWPDQALLGELAVGSATGDAFATSGDDQTGGLWLRGLDPGQRYTLRLFAGREEADVSTTVFTLRGAPEASATVQTSGKGAGSGGGLSNDDTVVSFSGVVPDAWGHVFLDVAPESDGTALLGVIELVVE